MQVSGPLLRCGILFPAQRHREEIQTRETVSTRNLRKPPRSSLSQLICLFASLWVVICSESDLWRDSSRIVLVFLVDQRAIRTYVLRAVFRSVSSRYDLCSHRDSVVRQLVRREKLVRPPRQKRRKRQSSSKNADSGCRTVTKSVPCFGQETDFPSVVLFRSWSNFSTRVFRVI